VKDTSDPETIRLLARTYNDLDRPADAKKVLARLGAAGERDGAVQHALAVLRAGRTELANKTLTEAAAKEPGNAAIVGPLVGALAEARRFEEALAAADRLGQNPGQRVAALVYRGNALLLQRKVAEAKTAFDKAVGLEPGNAQARLVRANFLTATQKYDDATKDLRAVLASDPKNAAARVKIAQIAALQGKDQEARKGLEEAIASSPQDASPRLALTRYLMARDDHKTALRIADELVRLQPANAEGVALRGQVQSALGQKQAAVESFRQLVSLAPTDAQSKLILSDALFAAGDRAGAQRVLDEAVKIDPNSAAVKIAQIRAQLTLGNSDAAVASARAFQASHPGSQADILLADTLAKAKRFDQASDVLGKSLSAKPDQQVLSKLVEVKLAMNNKKAATNALSQWLARNPGDLAARQILAMILMGEKDNAGARTQYEAILKLAPANALAMNNLGYLIQTSDPGRALALFTKAVQLAPNSADTNDSLGWLKVQQKDAAAGVPYLKRAHDLRPQDAAITYHLIVALDASGQRNEARALLKSLLASGAKFEDLPEAQRLAASWR
jgi:putative PEP-CTERM system TPR-repeat lipoprotein